MDKFQDTEFTCEYKYDGERAQLHVLDNGSVMIFSRCDKSDHALEDWGQDICESRCLLRNSENNTSKYPDIVERLKRALKARRRLLTFTQGFEEIVMLAFCALQPEVKSIVLDAEAVAYDKEKKKILPFQVLSTRKRKDVNARDISVQVRSYASLGQ